MKCTLRDADPEMRKNFEERKYQSCRHESAHRKRSNSLFTRGFCRKFDGAGAGNRTRRIAQRELRAFNDTRFEYA